MHEAKVMAFVRQKREQVLSGAQRAPQGKGIPWHRVLNAAGKIVIREPYSSLQRRLLESEGVEVIENRVKMKTYLWAPPRKKPKAKRPAKRTNKRTSK